MTRDDCSRRVKDIMINKNPYGMYHKQNFDTYGGYGEMAPINSAIINNMPSGKIIITEEVYEMIMAVQEVTVESNQEIPFFLYGKERENNTIEFNEFYTSSTNRQSAAASFNRDMINNLEQKVKTNLNNNFVVCHGHSHPPIGDFHQNFSLGDFTSYVQMNENNPVFKNKQVELTSCLVTSTGDVNFVFYDNQNNNFYRFTNVYVLNRDNTIAPVNCYGLNQTQNYMSNGNVR